MRNVIYHFLIDNCIMLCYGLKKHGTYAVGVGYG